jgi:hypothetical protein
MMSVVDGHISFFSEALTITKARNKSTSDHLGSAKRSSLYHSTDHHNQTSYQDALLPSKVIGPDGGYNAANKTADVV